MAELKDYITYPEDKGSIHISDEVVAKIAARAAADTDGVASLATNLSGEIARMFNKKGANKGIRIEKSDNELTVEVFLVALSGYSLREVGENVQKNVLAYLDKLLNDLGYIGFRYDFVKGFAAKYVGQYNVTAQPQFSVGECWDGSKSVVTNWINGTKQDGVIQSAAFDFPLKYYINDAFSQGKWSRLNDGCLSDDNNYKRYSVTFVDNHDTGRFGECPLYANVEAANAYILTMPGTPCVWLSHWKTYKSTIKRLIIIRKAAGIHNQSAILKKQSSSTGYVLNVEGTKGKVLLLLGEATADTNGYKLANEGINYKIYVTENVDISALDDIKDEVIELPDFCTVTDGEVCAFFEAPTSGWSTVKCWAWDSNNNYTGGSWPGATCTKVGTINNHNVWKWTYNGPLTTLPQFIIFNNNNNGQQTPDLVFQNHCYYNESGTPVGIVTGINEVRSKMADGRNNIYDLQGRRVSNMQRGFYIVNGKKVVIK